MVKALKVEFSQKPVSPWGGLKVMKDMVGKLGVKDFLVNLIFPNLVKLIVRENFQTHAYDANQKSSGRKLIPDETFASGPINAGIPIANRPNDQH